MMRHRLAALIGIVLFASTGAWIKAQDPSEIVTVVLADGPYFTGLYHRQGCWWLVRGSSRLQTMSRSDADRSYFLPHGDCMTKPVGGNSRADAKAPPGNAPVAYIGPSPELREMVSVRLSVPHLNGLYHRIGCWWLFRAGRSEVRTIQRGDAERRYFRPHDECASKPPGANGTPPPEFQNERVTPKTIYETTSLADFQRLSIGMSLSETKGILGSGELKSESQIGATHHATYEWSGEGWIGLGSFVDGKLVSKHQHGLK